MRRANTYQLVARKKLCWTEVGPIRASHEPRLLPFTQWIAIALVIEVAIGSLRQVLADEVNRTVAERKLSTAGVIAECAVVVDG